MYPKAGRPSTAAFSTKILLLPFYTPEPTDRRSQALVACEETGPGAAPFRSTSRQRKSDRPDDVLLRDEAGGGQGSGRLFLRAEVSNVGAILRGSRVQVSQGDPKGALG